MKSRNNLIGLTILFAVFLSACGGAATPDAMMADSHATPMVEPTHDTMMESPTEDAMMPQDASTPDTMPAPTAGAMVDTPAWYSATLTDARTGQTFSIDGLKGKVVLVETMAIWCTNCLKQQGQVKALHEQLGARGDFASVGLDIDPNENTEALKAYVENKGFDWLYAVPSRDVSREIAALYGDQFLNPPSTPIVLIDRHGEAHPLPFGIKSADDLMQVIQPFLDESM